MTGWRSEAELRQALEEAKATQRLEGIEVSAEQEALALRRLRGEITEDELIRLAVELAKRNRSSAG
jgi:hypothetical protein